MIMERSILIDDKDNYYGIGKQTGKCPPTDTFHPRKTKGEMHEIKYF